MLPRKLDVQGIGMTSQRTRNRLVERLRDKGIRNEAVLQVMSKTPRHLLVDEALASRAYEDTALPIGHGQTISQPYIVARMTALLLEGEQPPRKVLEVGTGSGYQAAILSPLVEQVFTVERIEPLYRATRALLHALGYRNIHTYLSDGSWGLAREAPFDAIIATAAPEAVPPALLEQLAIGGKLIIPVGKQGGAQMLQVITRDALEIYTTIEHEAVQFVPMIKENQSRNTNLL
ncbi:protein-L-isoaspartate(D-aspartate) O-methyltransferase [Thiothrix caldifontis]|uniref:Protein-L-isoaspartate O-methyltransferase n=1 Tax=Thiothrix caldifontis TaxID=525918 RepID=A0A1H3VK37_9GAMM|nr:protein-L-isoaspartate(D-aspartate) O-methyltransferase [Thiothrix caldifontis]SDZ75145.1 protein-L-isoaspartate(D-aspartate) O-methyltransferase [Thiothrix caldifontis]